MTSTLSYGTNSNPAAGLLLGVFDELDQDTSSVEEIRRN